MRNTTLVFLILALAAVSTQAIVDPLAQYRSVKMSGSPQVDADRFHKNNVMNMNMPAGSNDMPMCKPGHPDFFKYLGVTVATLSVANPTAEYETPCFKRTTYTVEWVDDLTAKVHFANYLKKSLFCADHYTATTLISTDLVTNWQLIKSTTTYKFTTHEEAEYARTAGIKVILMCDSWLGRIPDMIKTFALFMPEVLRALPFKVPNNITEYFYKQCRDFITRFAGVTLEPRNQKVPITFDWVRTHVQSGDVLTVRGMTGMGTLIWYGTGGPVSHAAIAMWDEHDSTKLWILEANDMGLVRMELHDWWAMYEKRNVDIAWQPLSPASRKAFNANKAWAWFRSVENLAYGTHNLMYSMLDDVLHNFAHVVDVNSFILMIRDIDMLAPGAAQELIGEGLNRRLGTNGLDFAGTLYEIQRRGLTLDTVLNMPELDGFTYYGFEQYVCSCLAIEMLRQGGLFQGLDINPHEFTPRDVFMVQLWNNDPNALPTECQQNDPGVAFCQIRGQWKIDPTLYNTIKPYSHMNDACPSVAPQFFRPSTC